MKFFKIISVGFLLLTMVASANLFADSDKSNVAPIKLKVGVESGYVAKLTWSDDAPGKKVGYNIYWSKHSGKDFSLLSPKPIYENTAIYGLDENRDYYFVVKPVSQLKPLVEGPESNEVKATITNGQEMKKFETKRITQDGPHSYTVHLNWNKDLKFRVRILDEDEKSIRELADGYLPENQKTLHWDGKDKEGKWAPPGEYAVQIDATIPGKGTAEVTQSFRVN